MKIAVSANSQDINSKVSDVFGRCPYFIIAEIKDKKVVKTELIENQSANQNSGAGVAAAQLMAEKDINIVITGNMGPRALDILKQFNIAVYTGKNSIQKALQELLDEKLEKIG